MTKNTMGVGLLGPVSVHLADRPVELGGAQRRAVLARLALVPGRVVTFDALVDGLWFDPPATARKVVQVQVSRLRASLPPGAVATSGGGYRLDVDPDLVDAHRFEAAAAGLATVAGPGEVVARAEAAEALWRGPALGDIGDVPFVRPAAARLDEIRSQVVDARVAALLDLGRYAVAVAELEALVGAHPLRERLWASLVTALHRSGRQADALRAYERGRCVLADVGISPGPDLRAARASVVAGAPGEGHRSAPAHRRSEPVRPPRATAPGPLVGRDAERDTLLAAVAATRRGRGPGFVAIRGEEGLGKTSLLVDAAERPEVEGVTVVVGRCRQHVAVPFAPWAEVLHQLGAHEVDDLLDTDAAVESAEARRVRLFSTTVERLRGAADETTVMIVLDDLHWADAGTTDLLLHVLGETAGTRTLVVGAWRPGDVAVGRPAVQLVDHVARTGRPTIDLSPLTTNDIAEMLATHAPAVAAGERSRAAARLLEVTSGVPLFVADAVGITGGRERGLTIDIDRPRVPETARSIVARRLTEAGADTLPVAEAAAVLDEGSSVDLLADLVGGAPAEVLTAVDRLCDVGLLCEDPSGARFTHAAFRAAVTESTRRGRLQALHAHAFALLGRDDEPAARLAHHADGAGRLLDAAVASTALGAAGAEAAGRGAFTDAVRWYQRAVDRAPDAARSTVRVALSDALWRAGDIATAKAAAAGVIDGAVSGLGDPAPPDTLVDAAVLHSTVGAGFGPDADSIELLTTVLDHVDDPLHRAHLEVGLAYHHAAWGSPAAHAREAIATARRSLPADAPADLEAHLRFAEGLALLDCPDIAARTAQTEALHAFGVAQDAPRTIGRALRLRGMIDLSLGDLDALAGTIAELDVVAHRTGSWMYQSDVWRWRAAAALALDDGRETERAVAELERLAANPLAGRVFVGTQKLLLARARGDLDQALVMVDAMRSALPAETAWQTDRRLADLYRLDLLWALDRPTEAAADLDEMAPWTELHLSSCRRYPAELAMIATAVARAGLVGPAVELAPRVAPFAGQQVVLGWGEALLGSFDDCLALLDPVASGAPRASG